MKNVLSIQLFIQLLINGFATGTLYALPALGLSLIWNATGAFNFAQGDLLTLGGYMMYTFYFLLDLPYPLAFTLAVVTMGIVGALLSKLYFYPMFIHKINPHITLIGTVALSVFLQNLALVIWGSTPVTYLNPFGIKPLTVSGIYIMPHVIWYIAIVAVLVTALQYFLRGTIIGTAMRAVAQNSTASWLMGIQNDRMISLTFVMSTAIAAVSGILISPIITLSPTMGGTIGVKVMASALIGGLGNFKGALIGGVLVGVAEAVFSAFFDPAYKEVFVFGLLLIFMIFRPGGIYKINITEKA